MLIKLVIKAPGQQLRRTSLGDVCERGDCVPDYQNRPGGQPGEVAELHHYEDIMGRLAAGAGWVSLLLVAHSLVLFGLAAAAEIGGVCLVRLTISRRSVGFEIATAAMLPVASDDGAGAGQAALVEEVAADALHGGRFARSPYSHVGI